MEQLIPTSPFNFFCKQLNIKHVTGIPYNPMGQGMVKHAHATIKIYLQKTKKGELCPPCLSRAQLNFLTLDKYGKSAAKHFWHPKTSMEGPLE